MTLVIAFCLSVPVPQWPGLACPSLLCRLALLFHRLVVCILQVRVGCLHAVLFPLVVK